MSETTTRRDVLKTAAVTGAVGSFAVQTAAGKAPTARIVEAGIRYDVSGSGDLSSEEELQFVLPDSRPSYTVDAEQEAFVLANDAPDSLFEGVRRAGNFLNERTGESAEQVTVGRADNVVSALPTELSARMRPKKALSLDVDHRLPTVTLHWNGNAPAATIESKGQVNLSSNAEREVRLPSETVEATTVRKTDETVEVEGVPDQAHAAARLW